MSNLLHSEYASLAKDLLMLLDEKDLYDIVKTATSGKIVPHNKEEAYDVILMSCPNATKLLSLRKLSTVFLMRYLTLRNVVIKERPSKAELVQGVLDYWAAVLLTGVRTTLEEPSVLQTPDLNTMPGPAPQPKPEPKCVIREEEELYPKQFIKKEPLDEENPSSASASEVPVSLGSDFVGEGAGLGPSAASSNADRSSVVNRVHVKSEPVGNNGQTGRIMSDEFAVDFCAWFYKMVNKLQPCFSDQEADVLKPDIFCRNCNLEMYLVDGERMEQCKASSNTECNKVMRELLSKLGLLFMPNCDGGIQAKKSSHGIIQVFCCGTIHCKDSFVGIFEQEFGLVASPVDRSWKIAYSKINLKKLLKAYTPSLPPAEVFAIEY